MEYAYSQPRDLWEEKLHIRSHNADREITWTQQLQDTNSGPGGVIPSPCPQGHVLLLDRITWVDPTFNEDSNSALFVTRSPFVPTEDIPRGLIWAFTSVAPGYNQLVGGPVDDPYGYTRIQHGRPRVHCVALPTPAILMPGDDLHVTIRSSSWNTATYYCNFGMRLAMAERGTWPYTDTRTEAGSRGAPNHPGGAGPIDAWTPNGDGLPVPEPEYRQGDGRTSAPGEGRTSADVVRPQS